MDNIEYEFKKIIELRKLIRSLQQQIDIIIDNLGLGE